MKTTERFDVQYYKSIIKEKNSYEGATSAQYVKTIIRIVFSNPKGNCFAIQVSKLAFGASMTIRVTL